MHFPNTEYAFIYILFLFFIFYILYFIFNNLGLISNYTVTCSLPYPLYAQGSQIVGPDGVPVRIAGVGLDWGFTLMHTINYKVAFNTIYKAGINCVRITTVDNMILTNAMPQYLNYTANPDLEGLAIHEVYYNFIFYYRFHNATTPPHFRNHALPCAFFYHY
jgi:hypothetical protein